MDSKVISNGILRAFAILAGVALLALFLFEVRAVIAYIAIAAVISLLGRPIVLFLRNKLKIKNTIAVILTMIVMIGFLIGLASMFIPLIIRQGKNLSLLDINELQSNLEDLYREISDYFAINDIDLQQKLQETDWFSKLDLSAIPDLLNSVAGTLGSLSAGIFSVLFISFFFLKDSKLFEQGILVFVPESDEGKLKNTFEKIKDLLSRYFAGLLLQILILFVIYTVVLLFFGIKNAVVIAFLCALLNLIPYIGPIIGGALMVILTMSSNLGASFSEVILPKTIYVFIGFLIGQLVDNIFSQPYIFSNSVRSHPLEIFLIIIIAGILFGPVGMMIAIPGYTTIKVMLKAFLADNKIVRSLTKNI
ncbi:AI-2E family transporter [Ascidiimonas aurantiaca]|uniref:AI-2E family transporter n=1 Tax=Ascidiimonas aurantiaca TaxID=1685432 RepID=UPI0030EBD157